jgi:mannitol-1-phosphate 5-dehydrogenase
MKILIVGAGRIGRGFLAHLFARAGWSVTFVERAEPLVEELQRRGSYTVHLADEQGRVESFPLSGFTVLPASARDAVAEQIGRADLLAVAVQPDDLPAAADLMAPGLRRRLSGQGGGLNLIVCANISGAGGRLRGALRQAGVPAAAMSRLGVVESIVIRVIPDPPATLRASAPLDLLASDWPELYLDRDAVVGAFPEVPGVVLQDRFAERERRKLYTYNMTHALLGFWGQAEGYEAVADCFRDPWIRRQAERALEEATFGLSGELGFSAEEMGEWNAGVRRLMSNPHVGDRVERLVRDPLRKLAREERLTRPCSP